MRLFKITSSVTIKIDGFDTSLILDKLTKECIGISLDTAGDSIYVKCSPLKRKKILAICDKYGFCAEVVSKEGAYFYFKRYAKRYGIAIGAVMCAILIYFLSNITLKVRIVGASDEQTEQEIRDLVAQEGVKPGAYIPDLDFLVIGSKLVELSDDVAWASIGHSGPVVTVNVSMMTNRVETDEKRMPCNIVAARDGVIVSATVPVGEFCSLVGTAVKKGDLLVSGIVENKNGIAYYYHSIASVIAEYETEVEFSQPLYETVLSDGDKTTEKYLMLFELDIPLSFSHNTNKSYDVKVSESHVKLFGITLPIGIKTAEYTEKIKSIMKYTEGEAKELLNSRLANYEATILRDEQILSRVIEYTSDGGVVKMNVTYKLRGDIAEESPIFTKQ